MAAWDRCSDTWQCDEGLVCIYDTSLAGDVGVSICAPQDCAADIDCEGRGLADHPAICDATGSGTCVLACTRVQDCPAGMLCVHDNFVSSGTCAWPL